MPNDTVHHFRLHRFFFNCFVVDDEQALEVPFSIFENIDCEKVGSAWNAFAKVIWHT